MDISKFDDVIDLRDVISRFEELEALRDDLQNDEGTTEPDMNAWQESEEGKEFTALQNLLEECRGCGGDEQWRGDWYPVTLVRDSYFIEYAQELAEECCSVSDNLQWPYTCIDWEKAARELQYDYTGVEFDGITYWTR